MSIRRASPAEYFETLQNTFTVSSSPVVGVPFKLNGATHQTAYNGDTLEASVTLEAYPSIVVSGKLYVFKNWDDGLTSLVRTGNLLEKTSYSMIYEPYMEQNQTAQLDYRPVLFAFIFGCITITCIAYLASRR